MATFQINFLSQSLHRTVPLYVILPTDKFYAPGTMHREKEKPYKTLYLLHGLYGNYTDWLHGTRIQRWAEEKELAVVMPSGDNSYYVDQPWSCNMYSEFIGKELVEFTRKTFPLSDKREDTFIAGLSMGGFGALHNGLKYHETFGYIAALSTSFRINSWKKEDAANPALFADTNEYMHSCFGPDIEAAKQGDINPVCLVERLVKEGVKLPSIYMACGEQDELLTESISFVEFLKTKNVPVAFETGVGNHEWDFWDTYIKKVLEWLPLETANAGINSGNIEK